MELIDNFNTDQWQNSDPDQQKGFVLYTMVRAQFLKPGHFKYAVREVRDDEGDSECSMLALDGTYGKTDPLMSVRNMELIVRDGAIFGINIDGECVVRKDL